MINNKIKTTIIIIIIIGVMLNACGSRIQAEFLNEVVPVIIYYERYVIPVIFIMK